MITIEKTVKLPNTYPLERIGALDELLFFDIETTGFSGEYSNLYLIGCVYFDRGDWNLIQWFADTPGAEEELLHAFFDFLSHFTTLIHFNGDGFDIPYLLRRCEFYGLSYGFSQVRSLDIYKKIRPYKTLLGLDSLKQKAIERFLGVSRTDRFSGGDLIEVYKDYLVTHEKSLYDLLILHNEDDLKGMPSILPILCYPDFLEHPFVLKSQEIKDAREPSGDVVRLRLILESEYGIPVPLQVKRYPYFCSGRDNKLSVTVDLHKGCLKYFFPNPKDYYYLIYEDTAVHKSVGEYVDREARVKATTKNCYTKKEGSFLPLPKPLVEPVFRQSHCDKNFFTLYSPALFEDKHTLNTYLDCLLEYLSKPDRKKT